ncbi:MAG: hypothetical protein HFJ25_03325 [Clostridia bacterium]|jgi:outer membrane biosynthesis protein TonB|nr:hypothetical protein [Clostridia bacterium]
MWEKIKKNKKRNIVIAVVLFFLLCIGISEQSKPTNTTKNISNDNSNYSQEVKEVIKNKIDVESVDFLVKSVEIDVSETKDFILIIKPIDADIEKVEIVSSNENILKVERNLGDIESGKISFKIIPVSEGEAIISAKVNEVQTLDNMSVKVIDNDRIEREKKEQEEKQHAEEVKKQEEIKKASQAAPKINNNQSSVQSGSTNSGKQTNTQGSSSSTSPAKNNSSNSSSASKPSGTTNYNGQTVYITPSGEKYHYLSTCGGKNSKPIDLDSAKARGYGPCKKCAH